MHHIHHTANNRDPRDIFEDNYNNREYTNLFQYDFQKLFWTGDHRPPSSLHALLKVHHIGICCYALEVLEMLEMLEILEMLWRT